MTRSSPPCHASLLATLTIAAGALLAGGCVQTYGPVCVAGAKLSGAGQCIAKGATWHHIPFESGHAARVTQGYHGQPSHVDTKAYSVDFQCDVGDHITASRPGIVWDVKEDSNEGCSEASCADQANFVILDHGDGTFSEYYHLQHYGALVEPGESVCAGQLIGLCGNTGFSTGAHLHFAVSDLTHQQTIPVRFFEMREKRLGIAVPETEYVSENDHDPICAPTEPSPLPKTAFAHHGVLLDEPLPRRIRKGADVVVRGRYIGGQPKVAAYRKMMGASSWQNVCTSVGENGRFAMKLEWPEDTWADAFYYIMITGANKRCSDSGWAWSYKVRVGEPSASGAPIAQEPSRDEPRRALGTIPPRD
ncbi:MAG: M23 family metallopeptidase [Myxococcota bacterium]